GLNSCKLPHASMPLSLPPRNETNGQCRAGPLTERDGVHSALVGTAAPYGAFRDIEHAPDGALARLLPQPRIRDAQCTEALRVSETELACSRCEFTHARHRHRHRNRCRCPLCSAG